jgi:hypothetical protein
MIDGHINVKVTDAEPGYLNVRMTWPRSPDGKINAAEMTIGIRDAATLVNALFSHIPISLWPDIR